MKICLPLDASFLNNEAAAGEDLAGSLRPNVDDSALSSGWKTFDYVPQRNGGRKAVEFLSRHSKFYPGNSGLGAKILV